MRAAYYNTFQGPISICDVKEPELPANGVIIQVKASGLCRSDWHGWMGHDPDIQLPHIPGHELAGVVLEAGKEVKKWQPGDRVTVPFSVGCGFCGECQSGNQQICDNYFQPGFTAWGSFAEYVAIPHADSNLVRLPPEVDFVSAAILGCRFITSYRGVVAQGNIKPGQWLVVHGCGGVGLSAILIGVASGARVVAVDILDQKLAEAKKMGAEFILNAQSVTQIPKAVQDITKGGAHISIDALGSTETCINSILCLRKRGKHIQIGLMTGKESMPAIPMGSVIAKELKIIGSHGMQAHQYPPMLDLIRSGKIKLQQLLDKTVSLEEVPLELSQMNQFKGAGVRIIDRF